ncbi:MAG: hypothetical protein C4558_04885 [Dehalococcoidia bacterium]|nr:MAG: hypothetical protein C4558_04885 [Dehalococcoidia bacterium]
MPGLAPKLRAAAIQRGVLDGSAAFSIPEAVRIVRDLPYARASDRRPETVIEEWRGTCSGKHYLLAQVLEELGASVIVIHATHHFTPENSPWLPPDLLAEAAREPVPDVHTFLRVQLDAFRGEWFTVDVTWPLGAKALGMPVNEGFDHKADHRIAADVEEIVHVDEEDDPQAVKEALIQAFVDDQAARRDAFIERLSAWLGERLAR